MVVPVLLFIVGFVCLIKGGDWFVDGAAGIASRFKMPELLVGATVVSIGTTLPETIVSASSAVQGHGEIAYGNAIGSIICNTALVAAITLAIRPSKVDRKTIILPTCFFFAVAAFYSAVAYTRGYFSRLTGVLLLIVFVVYMTVTVRQALKDSKEDAGKSGEGSSSGDSGESEPILKLVILLVVGAAAIAVGADLLIDNGTLIATAIGVPESVIALTFVALGTSLPELITAITSLRKGVGALSLGNVIGANLFNLLLVTGLACTLSPFPVPVGKQIAGIPASFVVDIPLMLFVMTFMTVPSIIRGKGSRVQGIVLLVLYAAFVVFQFA